METAKIEALDQFSDLQISNNVHEIFEKGDRIEVPVELLGKLDPAMWKRLPKNAKLIRHPVKYYGTNSSGQRVNFYTEPEDQAKAKATSFIPGSESVGLLEPEEVDA